MRGCEFLLHAASSLIAVLVVQNLGGCTKNRPSGIVSQAPVPPQLSPDDLRERAQRTFERAIFYKPREESPVGIEGTMAPLIVEEFVGNDADPLKFDSFGSINRTLNADAPINPHWVLANPTIYYASSTIKLGSRTHEQLVYLWWYAARHDCPEGRDAMGRGVRITLDQSGFPMVWEALEAEYDRRPHLRVLFVSSSLESRARQQFGEPLPSPRFSIEGPDPIGSSVVVAGLVDDASTPMGPYVYLDAYGRRITRIACRCMPSQFDSVVQTRQYDMQPMETLAVGPLQSSWEPLPGSMCPPPRWGLFGMESLERVLDPAPGTSLDRILRWPANAP